MYCSRDLLNGSSTLVETCSFMSYVRLQVSMNTAKAFSLDHMNEYFLENGAFNFHVPIAATVFSKKMKTYSYQEFLNTDTCKIRCFKCSARW